MASDSVGAIAELYLGNLLYALERCAMSLDEEGKATEAAFYRGLGRKMADAHGQARSHGAGADTAPPSAS